MSQIFHPSANHIAKASIFGGLLLVAVAALMGAEVYRSPYFTQVGVPRDQPVPFSHEHHVAGLGIDCRYCHTQVEQTPFAGMPTTKTCMTCHSQIWTNAEILEPVRESWRSGKPLAWTRVHDVPDYVYFNHSIHVAKGVGCSSCHGEVQKMPLMWKAQSLQMEWCVSCHREPEKHVRPQEDIYNMSWMPGPNQAQQGKEIVEKNHISAYQLTNCSVCHR